MINLNAKTQQNPREEKLTSLNNVIRERAATETALSWDFLYKKGLGVDPHSSAASLKRKTKLG
jgi:hypothetical protein